MLTTTSIHGHEVIQLIVAAEPALTTGELADAVRERWGADARFHTCSARGMTLDELLIFLSERGKLVPRSDGRLEMNLARVCSHDDGDHQH